MARHASSPAARTAVVALGGNALAPSDDESDIYAQFRHTRESLALVVELVAQGWRVCIVHGNGPQVGDELVRNEVAIPYAKPLPLGVLVAATAGWIGYMIQQSLENALRRKGLMQCVATVITQVEVDPDDPALKNPTKFIGHEVGAGRARQLEADGQVLRADGRGRLRRVVGSPGPRSIHEIETIRALLAADTVVIAGGGGGAPVYRHPELGWEGIDAVVDKDLVAAVMARDLGAELVVILTDVDAVYSDWGKPTQRALRTLTVGEAEQMDRDGTFGEGSMAPKVRAALDFVRTTGGRAVITELTQGLAAVRGEAGTTFTAS